MSRSEAPRPSLLDLETLLAPVSGDAPAGPPLRHEETYDAIREARREEKDKGGEAAKAVYRQRAATAECANAQCRNRGLLRFLVRSLEKAKAVGLWHALAHNMVCTGRLLAA